MTRTGRRRGPSTTRAALLEAARRRFAEAGYDATSLRAIAADAQVDPAVVLHFFGSKDGLFRAAVGWPFDPAVVAARITQEDEAELGERIARVFFELWDDPPIRTSLLAVLRSAMTHPPSAVLLREFVAQQLFGHVAVMVEGPDAELRLNLAVAHLIGVAVLRYIVAVEPLASAGLEQLVAAVTPAMSGYLGRRGQAPPLGSSS